MHHSWTKATHLHIVTVCRLRDQDITPHNFVHLRKALAQFFSSSTFVKEKCGNTTKEHLVSSVPPNMPSTDLDSTLPNLFLVPCKSKVDSPRAQYESYTSMLWKLRDQVSLWYPYIHKYIIHTFFQSSVTLIRVTSSGSVHELPILCKDHIRTWLAEELCQDMGTSEELSDHCWVLQNTSEFWYVQKVKTLASFPICLCQKETKDDLDDCSIYDKLARFCKLFTLVSCIISFLLVFFIGLIPFSYWRKWLL